MLLNLAVLAVLASPATSLPKGRLEGVNVVCANAEEPVTRRHTQAATLKRAEFVLRLAGANLDLFRRLVGGQANIDPAKITDPLDFPNGPIEPVKSLDPYPLDRTQHEMHRIAAPAEEEQTEYLNRLLRAER